MKFVVILFLFRVALLSNAFAQPEISLGFKGGLNFANVQTSSSSSLFNSRRGPQFGVFGLFRYGKYAIQPEVIYSGHFIANFYSGAYYDNKFWYLNIPVIVKRYFGRSFNLQAGPQLGFLTSATGVLALTPAGAPIQGDINSVNRANLSLGLGTGWDFPFGMNFDVRYNIGLSDTNKQSQSWEIRNRVVQVSVGYRFKLKKTI